jgi:DNA replication and repair protein RecF
MTHLAHIKGENFRLFERFDFQPHPRFNFITGENAAGKTSLLEAIYCLGRAKSFRGSGQAELAGGKGRHWSVRGKLQRLDAPANKLSVRWLNELGTEVQFDEFTKLTAADLVAKLPVQIIEPAMHRLLLDGPSYRRSFLDWGVFHVEQQFFPAWRQHLRALKQRNRALRQKSPPREIHIWDQDLASAAELLQKYRSEHLSALKPILQGLVSDLFKTEDWTIELNPGWPPGVPYIESLKQHLDRDRRIGTTVEGAHRAELKLKLDSHHVKNRISRGQQKLLIAALIFAQSKLINRCTGSAPILLIDDFSAELAVGFQRALAGLFLEYPGQIFVTAFERVSAFEMFPDRALFHVEHRAIHEC